MTPLTGSGDPNQVGKKLFGVIIITQDYIRDAQVWSFITFLKKICEWVLRDTGSTKGHHFYSFQNSNFSYIKVCIYCPLFASQALCSTLHAWKDACSLTSQYLTFRLLCVKIRTELQCTLYTNVRFNCGLIKSF